MEFREFLEKNYSEREYDSKIVDLNVLDELMTYAKKVERLQELKKVHFKLFDEGGAIFDKLNGIGGYSGYMIKGPHYIGIEAEDDSPLTDIITGYSGQAVVKKAFELGLRTCWIDLKDVPEDIRKDLSDHKGMKIDYLIAVGYSNKKGEHFKDSIDQSSRIVINNPSSITIVKGQSTSGWRNGVTDIVYLDSWGNSIDYDELESRGLVYLFYYVKNAPSYKNQQPWRFIVNGGDIIMGVLNPQKEGIYTDAGIMMYLIEGIAHELSIPGQWMYFRPEIQNNEGVEYAIVGQFNI